MVSRLADRGSARREQNPVAEDERPIKPLFNPGIRVSARPGSRSAGTGLRANERALLSRSRHQAAVWSRRWAGGASTRGGRPGPAGQRLGRGLRGLREPGLRRGPRAARSSQPGAVRRNHPAVPGLRQRGHPPRVRGLGESTVRALSAGPGDERRRLDPGGSVSARPARTPPTSGWPSTRWKH